MQILPLNELTPKQLERCASQLVECFAVHWPEAWPDIEDARIEVQTFFENEDRFAAFAAVDGDEVVGWAGGIKRIRWTRDRIASTGCGSCSARTRNWEDACRTSRAGITRDRSTHDSRRYRRRGRYDVPLETDLYHDLGAKIATIQNLKHHPYEFYLKLGYSIIGVVPDANGIGKPDIIMGRPLR